MSRALRDDPARRRPREPALNDLRAREVDSAPTLYGLAVVVAIEEDGRAADIAIWVVVLNRTPFLPVAGWRRAPYADMAHPATTIEWLAAYVGPHRHRHDRVRAPPARRRDPSRGRGMRAGGVARERGAPSRRPGRARRALGGRLHETLSQAFRAIPLRLDAPGPPPGGGTRIRRPRRGNREPNPSGPPGDRAKPR